MRLTRLARRAAHAALHDEQEQPEQEQPLHDKQDVLWCVGAPTSHRRLYLFSDSNLGARCLSSQLE